MILILQIVILCVVGAAVVMWWGYSPYPSPLIRPWLPAHYRWPADQIRGWLQTGRFNRSFLRYFYRDPRRIPPAGSEMLAPADGLVTSMEVRDDIRYLVIALSFWDMHVQYSPVSGKVLKVESFGNDFMMGEGRDFAFLREKYCPVQKRLVILSEWGEIGVRLITSLAARRIETWTDEGYEITRGQRIGRILLGSTVVLELPKTLKVLVKQGERVWAGETAIAKSPVTP